MGRERDRTRIQDPRTKIRFSQRVMYMIEDGRFDDQDMIRVSLGDVSDEPWYLVENGFFSFASSHLVDWRIAGI